MIQDQNSRLGPTVLVVDDAPLSLTLIAEMLLPVARVLTASSGPAALRLALAEPRPDLILLDRIMPEMDGFEVFSALRMNEATRDIPVIFVTSMDGDQDEELGLLLGAVDYVTKPVREATLLARVKTQLALIAATGKLKRHKEELEQRVHERTQALEHAMHAAEAGDRAKSQFLAIVGHELKTPMNGLIGSSSLLLDELVTAEQQELVVLLHKSALALNGVINDILEFSAAESLSIASESFHLRTLLDKISMLFEAPAARKELAFDCHMDARIPEEIDGDAGQLRQILVRLIDNAIKFTPHGQVSLTVLPVADALAEGLWLRFEVRDTGIGIPLEAQAAIFSAFAQADGSMTRQQGGMGLGLAITRRLVERMNGHIGIESEQGKGSLFWVELPFSPAPL